MTRPYFLPILAFAALSTAGACASEKTHDDDDDERDHKVAKVSAESIAQGKKTYMTVCAPCHGEVGKGDGPASKVFKPAPRDHTDAAYMQTISDEDLVRVVTMGGLVRGKPNMPGNPQLRGKELDSLVAYVRSLARSH